MRRVIFRRIVIVCCFFSVFVFQSALLDWYERGVDYGTNILIKATREELSEEALKAFDTCPLKRRDPWEGLVHKYVDVDYEKAACNHSFVAITYLEQGRVFIKKKFLKSHKCSTRCVLRDTDRTIAFGEWKPIENDRSPPFTCDVIYAECQRMDGRIPDYGYIHTQIYEKPYVPRNGSIDLKRYNVHVVLIDSTSNTQAYRNLPATMNFLEKSMDSITFPFLNRIGTNSRPNGIALWFGKLFNEVDKSLMRMDNLPADMDYMQICDEFFDDHWTIIMQEFSDIGGYKTMLAEDWGLLTYPKCKGLRNSPTDHYLKPFELLREKPSKALEKTLQQDTCTKGHLFMLNYLDDFLMKYENAPKFSWTWLSYLGHDNTSTSITADKDFLGLLLDRREELDNSFVIFMGDHGLRFGDIVETTSLGKSEADNPLFTIALPKKLRSNRKLVDTMRNNSKYLQTHFDVRATLLDILKYQPFTNFTSIEPMQMEGERGESLMRTQTIPRNCKALPVPTQFCLCQYPSAQLPTNTSLAATVSTAVVKYLNDFLTEMEVEHLCEMLEYDVTLDLATFVHGESSYFVSLRTIGPVFAKFRTTVILPFSTWIFSPKIGPVDRLDHYGEMGNCVDNDLRKFCICTDWMNKNNNQTQTTPSFVP